MSEARTETDLGAQLREELVGVPCLFVVLEGGRPLAGSARLPCGELDEIVLGRGDARGVHVDGRTAALQLPDRRMSSVHARVRRTPGRWELLDTGSKNGSRVDGALATQASLRDGSWIEVGQTLMRFRAAVPHPDASAARWLDTDDAPAPLGVATVLPAFAARLEVLARLAPTRVSLLLTGATGTGKELVARAIHAASGRAGPFVAVRCAALPADLADTIRAAAGGTLLLDDVGDLPAPAQAALLHALQERHGDVRVIGATHRDLRSGADAVHPDLLARLAGHVEELPQLGARREDLGTIIAGALRRHGADASVRLTIEAAHRLATDPWPHNLREVDRAIATALALAGPAREIGVEQLPPPAALDERDDSALAERLRALLAEHRGNITQIARAMGKARMQIQRWLRRFALDPRNYR